ncbi:FGGY-family carbohydrate kinase [Vibrio harveyi]|uniref:FGGY-family carbohydrate kinase n=1 Tax=Vibrio harveyi TaxID=669 RepID=UPI00165D3B38|nr:FGGY-family carbohydrate kinase [Vibrio harveyi]
MNNYILVLDRGSTNIKAVVFDTEGNEVRCCNVPCETPTSKEPGWWEQDINDVWEKTALAINTLFKTTSILPDEIIGVIPAGQGNGLIVIDQQGNLLRQGILSLDSRASEIFDGWVQEGKYQQAVSKVGFPFNAGSPLPLLAWLKRNDENTYAKIDKILFSKDWIKYKLCGEICTDYSDASGAGLIELDSNSYAHDVFRSLKLTEVSKMLPDLKMTHEIVGSVDASAAEKTGLNVGTPVLCGAHDMGAFPFGIGTVDERQLVSVMGTWGLNLLPIKKIEGHQVIFNHVVPDYYLTGIGDGNAGGCLDIMLSHLCQEEKNDAEKLGIDFYQHIESKISRDITSIVFLPYLFGSAFVPNATASLIGLKNWHTKFDILSAIYEGIVMGYYKNIISIPKYEKIDTIWLIGGGMKSEIFGQLFADISGFNVKIPSSKEVTARGCAMCALVGLGLRENHDLAAIPINIDKIFYPNKDKSEKYKEKFVIFNEIFEQNKRTFDKLNNFN